MILRQSVSLYIFKLYYEIIIICHKVRDWSIFTASKVDYGRYETTFYCCNTNTFGQNLKTICQCIGEKRNIFNFIENDICLLIKVKLMMQY